MDIKISYDEIVNKLVEKSGKTKEEIEKRIQEKLDQLSGLISKEGAGHIIANELNIKLIEQLEGDMKVKDLKPGMRNVSVVCKVLTTYELREFTRNGRQGKVCNCFIADETGNTRAVGWGSKADEVAELKKGDIVKFENVFAKENQGRTEIHLNDNSNLEVNPEDAEVNVDENSAPEPTKAERKYLKDLTPGDQIYEILGHIVQVFDIRFFEVCPTCQKRAKEEGDGFYCSEHGNVEPTYGYVINFIIDDGTENIRVVCFRNQLEQLLNKNNEEMLKLREDPAEFLRLKDELLGTIVKARGRVRENTMFSRTEFMAVFIDTNPDAEEELKKIEALSAQD